MEPSELLALGGGIALIVLLWLAGAPMFAAFVAGSIILFSYFARVPVTAIPQMAFGAMDKYVLTAIPVFILVGELMQRGGAGDAFYRLIRATVGHYRAGLAITAIVACMFFGAITGSCIATAVAIGSIVKPEMVKSGYRLEVIAAVCGTAGTLGIMIPPSISMIIMGDVLGASVGKLFIAGIIPGILCTLLM
ncbi:TRAP transporter large permease subunit, partial [Chloroflexota bacterium]